MSSDAAQQQLLLLCRRRPTAWRDCGHPLQKIPRVRSAHTERPPSTSGRASARAAMAALLLVLSSSHALLAPSFTARPPVRLAAASLRLPALHLSALDVPPSQVEDLKANAKGLFYTAYPKGGRAFVSNVLSGFTVSLAMIPEAVAFAFVAGVSPIVGLWTTVVMGFFAAAFGAGRGSMTGASGACAVVMTSLVAAHGPAYLSAAALLAGLYQVACGALGLGKFIRLVPHPVMLGFVNGLAIVMTRAQLTHFRDPLTGSLLRGARGLTMAALTVATMALVKLIPKLTTALPPSLLAVGIVTTATRLLRLPATTLVDIAGAETFAGGVSVLPKLGIPAMGALTADPLRFLGVIAPYAVTMGTVGLLESLLTVQLLDGLVDDGRRGSTRKECVGQGLGNVAAGLTSGMGGCALIGQSLINVQSGAPATPLAAPCHATRQVAPRCIPPHLPAPPPRPTSPHGQAAPRGFRASRCRSSSALASSPPRPSLARWLRSPSPGPSPSPNRSALI